MAKATLFAYAFVTILIALHIHADYVRSKIVNTTSGPVKGYKSSYGNFFAFFSVPYATAPTGIDKFKAPLPAPTWTEPFEAVQENIFCPQVKYPIHWGVTTEYQEDCLVANIFTPDTEKTNLSVVVYIHGGAYQTGAGNLVRPYEFLNEAKDIIFVNFNYRLGVQGFFCLGTDDIPGNAGMKDQVAALRWVKDNIAGFGGNSEDITLAGYSAGSSSADLLMLSEITDGLFTKVIPESGVGNAVWSVQLDPLENAKAFARQLNFITEDINDLEEFYKKIPYDQLTSDSFSKRFDHTLIFVPCVEKDLGQERFLKEAPVDILKNGNFKKLPTLIGFTDMEGLLRADLFQDWKSIMNEDFSKFLPADLNFKNKEERQFIANQIKQYYFGGKKINNETVEAYFSYLGDGMFRYPTIRNVRMQVQSGNYRIYLYQFSYVDNEILSTYLYHEVKGAGHCAQTYAVLENMGASFGINYPVSDNLKDMKSIMRKLWINFIKIGKPIPEVTSDFQHGWPAATAVGSPYMELTLPPQLKGTPLSGVIEFWDSIYDKHYKKPLPPLGLEKVHIDLK